MNPDGTANWDFSLPGDNAANHIEGIAVLEDQNLCIVADVSQTIGDSRHEVSCFKLTGQFIATNPTLEPLPRLGDPVKPRDPLAINLDDESLVTAANSESLYLAGSEYLLTAGCDEILDTYNLPQLMPRIFSTLTGKPLQGVEDHLLNTVSKLPVELYTELLEYSLDSGGDSTNQRIPSASWYLPYQVTGIDPFEYLYRDIDAKGITDLDEGELDSDGDGTHDYLDTDSDNDDILDSVEGFDDKDDDGREDYVDPD